MPCPSQSAQEPFRAAERAGPCRQPCHRLSAEHEPPRKRGTDVRGVLLELAACASGRATRQEPTSTGHSNDPLVQEPHAHTFNTTKPHKRTSRPMARSKTPTTTPSTDRRRRNPRGQAMAEFAIILPILLALVGGGIDFARAFEGAMTLQSAARNAAEAAAYSVDQPEPGEDECARRHVRRDAAARRLRGRQRRQCRNLHEPADDRHLHHQPDGTRRQRALPAGDRHRHHVAWPSISSSRGRCCRTAHGPWARPSPSQSCRDADRCSETETVHRAARPWSSSR